MYLFEVFYKYLSFLAWYTVDVWKPFLAEYLRMMAFVINIFILRRKMFPTELQTNVS
jgi:hypothetical protein